MNTNPRRLSIFVSTLFACLLITSAPLAQAQQDLIRDNTTNSLNLGGAWLSNGVSSPGTVGLSGVAIWSNNVTTLSNLSNGLAASVDWGGVLILNTLAPVSIAASPTSFLRTRAQGITVEGNDLTLNCPLAPTVAQSWNIAPGRLLTTATGPTNLINRSVSLNGTLVLDRRMDFRSNNTTFFMTNAATTATNSPSSITSTTNGTGQLVLGALGVSASRITNTFVHSVGSMVIKRAGAAAVLVVGNDTNTASFYFLSDNAIVDLRPDPDQTVVQRAHFGNDSNCVATLSLSNNSQFLVDVMTLSMNTNTTSTVNIAGTSILQARIFTNGFRGLGTINLTNSAQMFVTNQLALAGYSVAAAPNSGIGSGIVNLSGSSRLAVGSLARGGGNPTNTAAINFLGGTLQALATTATFSAANVQLNVGSTFPAYFDVGSNSVINGTPFLHTSGVIPDAGIVKLGSGLLTQRGANAYNGPTVVSNGTLMFDTTTLVGRGAIVLTDNTTLAFRRLTNSPTVTNSSLTAGSGTALNFDLITNGNPVAALMITTNLTINGPMTINITNGFSLTPGTFTVVDYVAATGTNNITLGTLPPGVEANLVYDSVNTRIDLNITATPRILVWDGSIDGSWVVGGPLNWSNAVAAALDVFKQGDTIGFDDSAPGTRTITLNTNAIINVDFSRLVVSNSAGDYSITGTGSYAGPFEFQKHGTGALTLGLASNDYTGNTIITGGTFKLAANEMIPHGAGRGNVQLDAGTTLDLNGKWEAVNGFDGPGTVDNTSIGAATFIFGTNNVSGTNVAVIGVVSTTNIGVHTGVMQNSGGPLTIWKAGNRTNILTGINSHTGGTVVSGGVLIVNDQAQLGATNNPLTMGASLWVTNGNITNSATVTTIAASTLRLTNGANALFTGPFFPTNLTGYTFAFNGGGRVDMVGNSGRLSTLVVDNVSARFLNASFTNDADLSLGRAATATSTLVVDGGNMDTTNNTTSGSVLVGDFANSPGTLHITNGAIVRAYNLLVARSNLSIGTIVQSSGALTNNNVNGTSFRIAAGGISSTGRYFLNGGRLDLIKALQIGALGNGELTVTAGEANNWSNSITIGTVVGAVGNVLVSGGSLNNRSNGTITVGNGGTGTLSITNTGLVTAVGNVTIGNSNAAVGVLNLGTGGRLRALRVIDGAGTNTLNFLGGTLEANANVANFISGLTNCVISSLGGTIDTGVFTVTAPQAFSGSGSLFKVGSGNLTLTASNHTHSGATIVSAGRLFVTPTYLGVSSFILSNSAGFGARIASATSAPSEVGAVTTDLLETNSFTFDVGVFGNPSNAVLHVTTLTIDAPSVLINVTGANLVPSATPIVLLDYDAVLGATGTNNIVLGTLPPGVTGHLEYNVGNTSIDLIIDAVAPTIWDGTADNVWNIDTTTNWLIGGSPSTYSDLVNVVFNDAATGPGGTSLTIASNVTPISVIITNSSLTYTLAGPGRMTGLMPLTKTGNGVAILAVSNDFTGQTTVAEGILRLGTNDVVPHGTGRSNLIVSAGGTLDLNGFNETLSGLNGSGTINNSAATNSSLTIGLAATASTFTGSIQNTGSPLAVFKNTTSTNTLGGASSYGGGTYLLAGTLNVGNNTALGTGPLTVAAAATLGASANVSFTNTVLATNTGTGTIDTTGGNITLGGPVFWTGPEFAKIGTGTLTFGPAATTTLSNGSEFGLFGGSVVFDGAAINVDNDSFRLRARTNAGSTTTVTATLQNNGSITLGDIAPFVLGSTADTNSLPPTMTNIFNLTSGTITVSNAGVFLGNGSGNVGIMNQTGGLVTSSFFSNNNGLILCNTTNSHGIYNLDGGALEVSRIRKITATNSCFAQFVFNGGTLRALNNLSAGTFMQGLDQALVSAGSGTIDTGTNNITILQNLLENPASTGGGLFKTGASNLTLTGTNTYTGTTTINNGRVVIGPAYSGLSPFVINSGAGLNITVANTNDIPTLVSATFNAGSSINFDLGTVPLPTNIFSRITNLTFTGATVVNLSGTALTSTNITLVSFDTESGTNNLTIGTLPVGVTGTLVFNPNSIELVVTVTGLRWTGVGSTLWEVAGLTNNWQDVSNTPTNYVNGNYVRFDDSATAYTATLITNVAPATNVVVSNVANNYLIDGAGGITGATRLTKQGAGTLTLANLTNTYNGGTWVEAGVLKNGTNEVIPAASGNLSVTGTYDLNGFVETLRHLEGNGTVDNTAAGPATLVLGVANNPGTFDGIISDTTGDLLIVKTNTGTNVFNGNSTWNGGMTIRNGQISAGHNNAFGTGLLTIIGGTVGTSGGARTLTNSISTFTNRVDINFRADGGDLTLTGPLDGNADVNKVGTNTLTIAPGANWDLHDGELAPRGGTTIISGSTITSSNGFRVYATTNFPVVDVFFTNNATMNLRLGGNTGNFILGRTDDTNNVILTTSFTMDSGTVSVGGSIFVANNIANVSTMTQNGGAVTLFPATNAGGLVIAAGTNSSGTYFLNAGTLAVTAVVKGNSTNTFARFVFGGGTLVALNASNAVNFMPNLDQAHVQLAGAKIDSAGSDITIVQALLQDGASPGGGLTKLGAGTLYLNGVNTYTGTTVVSNGTLAGSGTIAGPVSVTATGLIGAGNSIGTLTINNTLTIAGGAVMEINKAGITNTADKITGVTTLNYGGALNVTATGDPLVLGDSFDLFDAATPVGTFASFALPTLGGGLAWDFNQATGVLSVVSSFTPNVEITSLLLVGDTNLNFIGSGGPPNGTNYLRTSIDMTIPLASWAILETNFFDVNGNFNFILTNAITTETNRFYRVVLP